MVELCCGKEFDWRNLVWCEDLKNNIYLDCYHVWECTRRIENALAENIFSSKKNQDETDIWE